MSLRNIDPSNIPGSSTAQPQQVQAIDPRGLEVEDLPAPDVGIWGVKSSGKTLLLSAALYTLRTQVGYRMRGARPEVFYSVESDKRSQQSVERANEFINQIVAKFVAGEFPLGTTPGGAIDSKPFSLLIGYPDLKKDGTIGRFHRLNFMDIAGENVAVTNDKHPYWGNLRKTRGILFVVDGDREKTTFNGLTLPELIDVFLSMMHGNQGLSDKYLAICISKADAHYSSPDRLPRTDDELETELRDLIGPSVESLLTPFKHGQGGRSRYRIFMSSALGWVQDRSGTWVANYAEDTSINGYPTRMYDPRKWRPCQAAYPLLWLFDQIEDDNIRRYRPFPLNLFTRSRRKISNIDILRSVYENTYFP